jgi:thioredoxin-dependent peroxiredoxin
MPLKLSDSAPEFSLSDAQGQKICLSDFHGQWVVLYFYPRDSTPGCTKEACGFRDLYAEFQAQNIVVLGVSTDTAQAHGKFMTKYQLPFPLLCDLDAQVATTYESYGLKKFMGKEFMGVHRTTFLISPDGRIERIYRKVKPEAHAAEILAHFNLSQE